MFHDIVTLRPTEPLPKDNLVPKDGWPAGFSYTSSLTLMQQKKMRERAERRRERVQGPQKRLAAFYGHAAARIITQEQQKKRIGLLQAEKKEAVEMEDSLVNRPEAFCLSGDSCLFHACVTAGGVRILYE